MTATSSPKGSGESGPSAGRALGRYLLFDAIARGGMASVHFGRLNGPVGFSRTVAIKRLHPHLSIDPEFVTMFLDEARLASRIRHPNVVPTLDVVAVSGEVFIVMEYVLGESLGTVWRTVRAQGEQVPIPYALAVVAGALHGLHAAHDVRDEEGRPLGIVHRDVSPQNILVGADGVPRVLDFGVAKAAGRLQETGESGALKGKIAYMSPEQVAGLDVTRQSDIYSASVVLWELLAGTRLVDASNDAARMARILALRDGQPFPPPSSYNPKVPRELDAVVMRGLAGDPSARYATAKEMATLLEKSGGLLPASELGDWVSTHAARALHERAELMHAIEASSSRRLASSATLPAGEADATAVSPPPEGAEPTPPASRRAPIALLALLVVVLAGALGVVLWKQRTPAATSTALAAAPPSTPPATPAAPPEASAAPSASIAEVATPATPATSASAPAKPKPHAKTRTTPPAAKPKADNCDPPFVIDAENHKVYKRECLAN